MAETAERPARGHGNYDRFPVVDVGVAGASLWQDGAAVTELLDHARRRAGSRPAVVAIDCYPGVDLGQLTDQLLAVDPALTLVDVESAALPTAELDRLLAEELTEDRVFGVRSHRSLTSLYRAEALTEVAERVGRSESDVVLLGWGATLVAPEHAVVVLADLPRWEIQQRFRAGGTNWHADNSDADALVKFKRGYFVEWRVADEHKRPLLQRADYLLDTTDHRWKLITGQTLRAGLTAAVQRPFRVVPFFDPGPWGGYWMQEVCGLEPLEGQRYAWCFDCVPEENSLLLGVAGDTVEIPSLDVVLQHPRELLGELVHARFGAEFPIRFDLLDTVGGGNLSLQVHPLTDYIQRTFAMTYTQDESYYLLDATDDAHVYLGLRDGADSEELTAALRAGELGEDVDVDRFVNRFPARAHDHVLIPAGTVHASGAGSMVLEVSATPYIFTFKLWDWGRKGLDGRPRPIHLDHGLANLQTERDTTWAKQAINAVEQVDAGEGWREEVTGLHELEFIETRRHHFTAPVHHDTGGTVHVLNLVQGDQVVVESPSGAFAPFTVHYAETFIVPAAVGPYVVRPDGRAGPWATVRAEVRGTRSGRARG